MEPTASHPDGPGPTRKGVFPRPERGIGWAEGGRLTTRQRVVPAGALVVLLGAVAYILVPFTVAETVDCQAALWGSDPVHEVPAGAIVGDARKACRDVGNSRLSLAGVVGLAAVVIGAAGLFLPPDPDEEPPERAEQAAVTGDDPPDGEDG